MEYNELLALIIIALIALAAPSVLWFFRIRRILLMRQLSIINALEEVLRPKNKAYTLLGYLVGFKAVYTIEYGKISRTWALYTTPPSHVFFYLPVILMLKEKERLSLTIKARGKIPYTAHIIDPGDRWARRTFTRDYGAEYLSERCGPYYSLNRVIMVCGSSSGIEKALALMNSLMETGARITRISMDSNRNAVYIESIIENVQPKNYLELLKKEVNKIIV